MKVCITCLVNKSFDLFHMKSTQCKECKKTYDRLRYLRDPAAASERTKKYRTKVPESQNNILVRRKATERWRILNNVRMTEKQRDWRIENINKVYAANAKRRADRIKATPKWVDLKAIELIYEEAQFRTEFFGIIFHVDHIIPLKSKFVCGLHWEGNLQVILGVENLRKKNVWWPDGPMDN